MNGEPWLSYLLPLAFIRTLSIRSERQRDQKTENPSMDDVLDGIQKKARDHARMPMQVGAHDLDLFAD